MYYEPTLCLLGNASIEIILLVVIVGGEGLLLELGEDWVLSLAYHIKGSKAASFLDHDYAPVVEAAFPEFAKVYPDLSLKALS